MSETYTLTKENFWDAMQVAYPNAMRQFKVWIDEYKKRVNWEVLFNMDYSDSSKYNDTPKFHHLPIEMQWGIIRLFVFEQYGKQYREISFKAHKLEAENLIAAVEANSK